MQKPLFCFEKEYCIEKYIEVLIHGILKLAISMIVVRNGIKAADEELQTSDVEELAEQIGATQKFLFSRLVHAMGKIGKE